MELLLFRRCPLRKKEISFWKLQPGGSPPAGGTCLFFCSTVGGFADFNEESRPSASSLDPLVWTFWVPPSVPAPVPVSVQARPSANRFPFHAADQDISETCLTRGGHLVSCLTTNFDLLQGLNGEPGLPGTPGAPGPPGFKGHKVSRADVNAAGPVDPIPAGNKRPRRVPLCFRGNLETLVSEDPRFSAPTRHHTHGSHSTGTL